MASDRFGDDRLGNLEHDEMKDETHEYAIAVDGVSVIVNPSNNIQELTMAQVAAIFSGTATIWDGGGLPRDGGSGRIRLYCLDDNSGTYQFIDEEDRPDGSRQAAARRGSGRRSGNGS
jgi:ABC-type phosphate transport system substrate-binding protein